jgi:ADP-heptose:LPS heptosyltransferase
MSEKWLYFINILVSRFVNSGKKLNLFSKNPEKIQTAIVVKWDEIGDMLTAVHVFEILKKHHPQLKITVLCKPFVSTLIQSDPNVDTIITDVSEWVKSYDLVVELRGTWSTLIKSLYYQTMPKYRVDRGWVRFKQRGKQPHEIITNFRIIKPLIEDEIDVNQQPELYGINVQPKLFPSPNDLQNALEWSNWALQTDSASAFKCSGFAILHTGARSELRRWSPDRFTALSQWLLNEKNLMPVWVGTQDEKSQIEASIAKGGVGKIWISGELHPLSSSLLSFYAFIKNSVLFVGNESGPLQLADIAGIPTVAIFGPGVPNVFYPRSSKSIVLHEILPCNPCNQKDCKQPHDRCIDRISIIQVQHAVNGVLQ